MIYKEMHKNIFELDKKQYYFAHCISTDCQMGAGIAVDFNKNFHLKSELLSRSEIFRTPGKIILYRGIFNLFTKRIYSNKPMYIVLRECLKEMALQCQLWNIKYLAMPKIGCGLDRLSWGRVREMIKEEFEHLDIEIVVCSI